MTEDEAKLMLYFAVTALTVERKNPHDIQAIRQHLRKLTGNAFDDPLTDSDIDFVRGGMTVAATMIGRLERGELKMFDLNAKFHKN